MTDVKKLLAEATPLPWRIVADGIGPIVPRYATKPDAALIVYAVNRLPDYEAAVHELERLLAVSFHFSDCPWTRRYGATCTCGVDAVASDARAALARLRESVPA